MLYELAVCLRYLRPRFSRAYISFNTLISILGIAVGVTTLITVIAVMTGFGNQVREGFTGFFSHIIVFRQLEDEYGESITRMRDYADLLQPIKETEGVVAASPFVYINVTLQTRGMSYSVPLRGVVPELEERTSTIRKKMIDGDFAFPVETVGSEDPIVDEEPVKIVSVLIGKIIADEAKLSTGDTVRIASSTIGIMGREQRVLTARISGIFSYGTYDQDAYLYSSLETAQILQNIGSDVSGISILTEDLSEVPEVKRRLMKKLGEDYRIITWIEKNPDLFDLLNQERFIMFFIVALIIAVAALNIISSLSMMVNHKRKEIGILRSLGAKRRSITAIFGLMGVFIGTIGTGLGIFGGILISLNFNSIRQWVSNTFGFNLFSIFREIPVVVRTADIVIIGGIAISLCILVSIYPAWKASRLHPVEALRYE